MRQISTRLRRLVVERAANRCEYYGLAQAGQAATFHIDHIVPIAAAGETTAENLALACALCSLRKAARLSAQDPQTGQEIHLYNPRQQEWRDHFHWDDVLLVGLTPVGRATVSALAMNRAVILAIRSEEKLFRRHPPL